MDNVQVPGHPVIAAVLTFISTISGGIASIVPDVELWVRIGAGAIAIISGLMAIRYYYYATQKVQNEAKK